MDFIKNLLIGLLVLAGLAMGGFLIYVVGSMVLATLGLIISVVVAVAPIVLGIASAIFLVVGGAYAIGKAIREGGK